MRTRSGVKSVYINTARHVESAKAICSQDGVVHAKLVMFERQSEASNVGDSDCFTYTCNVWKSAACQLNAHISERTRMHIHSTHTPLRIYTYTRSLSLPVYLRSSTHLRMFRHFLYLVQRSVMNNITICEVS